MSAERWRSIPGLVGLYEVSDRGRVRNARTGRVRATPVDKHGYPRIVLNQNGKPVSWAVHRAVLAAFSPREDWRDMHGNHKDGETTNNRLENLEWCTNAENRLHSYRVLKRPNPMAGRCGMAHHNAVPVCGRCVATGEVRVYASVSLTATDGFKPADVSNAANGRQLSHKGWEWRHGTQAWETHS